MNYYVNIINNWKTEELDLLKVRIENDEWSCFDREDFSSENIKIDIMKHRNYNFQKDFWIDYEYLFEDFSDYTEEDKENSQDYYYYEEAKKKREEVNKDYYVFWLDYYEHSYIRFSLCLDRIYLGYYELDRTRKVGIIAVKKDAVKDEKEAIERARQEIENYNNYCNGRIYQYALEEKEEYFSKDLKKKIVNYDFFDGCWWFLNSEDCVNDARDSVKYYLNEKGIVFDDFELIEK